MQPGSASRAYVDRPISDLDLATEAANEAARIWRLSDPTLYRTGMNAIFVADDTVLRVSAPTVGANASIDLARFWIDQGVPVPRPAHDDVIVVGGLSVTGWERVESSAAPIDWAGVGAVVRRVHDIDPARLPGTVPLPRPSTLPWWDFEALCVQVASALDREARAGIERAIERHAGWWDIDGEVVCHGDVHPGNVIMTARGPVLLDWDLLCWAPPGWDHGPMMTWASRWGGRAGEYELFAQGYGRSLLGDARAEAFAELRLVAATLLRLLAGIRDPDAMAEAELRLRYWRGEPDAPAWTAQ